MPTARILVIEDNMDNYDLVRFLLEQEGYTVLGAYDGRQGLAMVREQLPEIILLDLSIPEIDGWELAAQLKADPHTARIAILALTGHTLPGDRQRALDAGCDDYISKPLDIPVFLQTVAAHIPVK
jgi:CheY-like chemotaxis protein